MSSNLIREGLAALRDGDAATARRAFELALATEGESGELLERLADALYLQREYAASASHYERAYTTYRRERANQAAGRAARAVAQIAGDVLGDWAVQSGWFARACTILEEAGEDGPERGWVLVIRAFPEPDPARREDLLREAVALGRRFGDPDLEFEALAYLGGLYIMVDRVEEGLVLLDEALAAACAGELREISTVDSIFCGFFWACELVNDVPRADQWMRAAADLMRRRNVVAAFCRAHYGGILTAAGRWSRRSWSWSRPPVPSTRACRRAGPPRSSGSRTCGSVRAVWRRRRSSSRASNTTRTPSAPSRTCTWPGAKQPWHATCWSGRPPAPTRSRRSGSRPWSGRCWRCWSTSTWRTTGSSTRPGRSSGSTASPGRSAATTSRPWPRSRRARSASPAARATRARACTTRWKGSLAWSCRWSWR